MDFKETWLWKQGPRQRLCWFAIEWHKQRRCKGISSCLEQQSQFGAYIWDTICDCTNHQKNLSTLRSDQFLCIFANCSNHHSWRTMIQSYLGILSHKQVKQEDAMSDWRLFFNLWQMLTVLLLRNSLQLRHPRVTRGGHTSTRKYPEVTLRLLLGTLDLVTPMTTPAKSNPMNAPSCSKRSLKSVAPW